MIPDPGLGKVGFMVLVLLLAAILALFSIYLKRSWMGFTFDAVADDEAEKLKPVRISEPAAED